MASTCSNPVFFPQASTQHCTTSFPNPMAFHHQKLEKEKERIVDLLLNESTISDAVQASIHSSFSCLSSIADQQLLSFELILYIIKLYSREEHFQQEDVNKMLFLLELCPTASKMKDAKGLMLIHHITLMEMPHSLLTRRLMELYPASCGEYALCGYIEATPLHLLLLKNEPDFELAYEMLLACPQAAERETVDGKLPIHLVVDLQTFISTSKRIQFIQKLLDLFPKSIFVEIMEEVHYLRLLNEIEIDELNNTNSSSSNSIPSPRRRSDSMDSLASMRIIIGQDQYKMEHEVQSWSPYERVMASTDNEVKALIQQCLQKMTSRQMKAQWKHTFNR